LQRGDYPCGVVGGDVQQRLQLSILHHARYNTKRAVNDGRALSSESREVDRVHSRARTRRHMKGRSLAAHDIDEAAELCDAGPCGAKNAVVGQGVEDDVHTSAFGHALDPLCEVGSP
jgi:hypothetical protein